MKLGHKGESDRLTIHLAIKKGQLVKPLNTLRFELGQLGFGFLCFGVVLIALGFQLLVIQGALLEGILGSIVQFLRLGLLQKGPLEVIFLAILGAWHADQCPLEAFGPLLRAPLPSSETRPQHRRVGSLASSAQERAT